MQVEGLVLDHYHRRLEATHLLCRVHRDGKTTTALASRSQLSALGPLQRVSDREVVKRGLNLLAVQFYSELPKSLTLRNCTSVKKHAWSERSRIIVAASQTLSPSCSTHPPVGSLGKRPCREIHLLIIVSEEL